MNEQEIAIRRALYEIQQQRGQGVIALGRIETILEAGLDEPYFSAPPPRPSRLQRRRSKAGRMGR